MIKFPHRKSPQERAALWAEALPYVVAPDSAPGIPDSVWPDDPEAVVTAAGHALDPEQLKLGRLALAPLSDSSRELLKGTALLDLLDS